MDHGEFLAKRNDDDDDDDIVPVSDTAGSPVPFQWWDSDGWLAEPLGSCKNSVKSFSLEWTELHV